MNINSRNEEIIRKFMAGCSLSYEEQETIIKWAKECVEYGDNCPLDCPLCAYKAKQRDDEEFPVVSCAAFFTKFIAKNCQVNGVKNEFSMLNELANQVEKLVKELRVKTKRETPMQVVVSHSNGKTIYHCYNCGKPLFIQASTQYCECCGQKLSFEVVENEI